MNPPRKAGVLSEVTSLGTAPTFDADSLDIEELERRFELTLMVDQPTECSCPKLQSCGTFCTPGDQ